MSCAKLGRFAVDIGIILSGVPAYYILWEQFRRRRAASVG